MYWGPGWGWIGGLIVTALFIAAIVVAAVFLGREFSHPRQVPWGRSPAVRLLEDRYARGEIDREEFLERRAVLLGSEPGAPPSGSEPTESDDQKPDDTQPIPPGPA